MNQIDRDRMARLITAVYRMPTAEPGAMSASMTPAVLGAFAYGWGKVKTQIAHVIMAISRCDIEDPDFELRELDKMVKEWESSIPW
jgi:hypothetical protein